MPEQTSHKCLGWKSHSTSPYILLSADSHRLLASDAKAERSGRTLLIPLSQSVWHTVTSWGSLHWHLTYINRWPYSFSYDGFNTHQEARYYLAKRCLLSREIRIFLPVTPCLYHFTGYFLVLRFNLLCMQRNG